MSNTGEKGIHYRAEREKFIVTVEWEGARRWGSADTLREAVRMRNAWERELRKPRSNRRIYPGGMHGLCRTVSGSRKVIEASIHPEPGVRLRTTFSLRDPEAEERAREWRRRMARKFYGIRED